MVHPQHGLLNSASNQRLAVAMALWIVSLVSLGAAQVNLFIWSEYIDPQVVKEFERDQQCKVVIDLFDEDSGMVAKLRNGGSRQYDVVVAPDHTLPRLIRLGLLRPLGSNTLNGVGGIHPLFRNPPFDPGNRHSVPYLWGTLCIYARRPASGTLEPTWGLLFDAKQQPGPFLMIDGMRDMIGAALKYKGHSLNTTNLSELREARALLIDAKRRSRGLEAGVGGKNRVIARRVQVAVAYSGDALRGVQEDPETMCIIPREGTQVWVDNLVLCRDAPHPELGERLIQFLSSPAVSARLANHLQYASPIEAARPWINPAMLANPAIYPPPEVLQRLEFLKDLGKEMRWYDEVWTHVRFH